MGSKVNYTIVGMFVIFLGVALITIAVWLGEGLSPHKRYNKYITYMNESVAGLSVNSAVKYNGVDVGFVESIKLRPRHPKQVALLLDIEQGTPITEATRSILMVQGLTGVAYMGLQGGSPDSPPLLPQAGQRYPVIISEPSFMDRLDTSIKELTTNLSTVSASINSVLDEENRTALKNSLQELQQSLAYIKKISRNTEVASQQFPQTIEQLRQAADSLTSMGNKLGKAGDSVDRTMVDGQVAMQTLSTQFIPQATSLMVNMQELTNNLEHLSKELNQNPSMLVRGRQPKPPGPGEK